MVKVKTFQILTKGWGIKC